jgi:hypothetical protein
VDGVVSGDTITAAGEMDAQQTVAIFTSLTPLTSEPFGGTTWVPVYQTGRSLLAPDAALAFESESLTPHAIDLGPYKGQKTKINRRVQTLGTHYFRVRAVYTDFFRGPWSNVVDINVVR